MQNKNQNHQSNFHEPVLLQAVLDLLVPRPGERYLDITAGYGGHASAIASAIGSTGEMTLVDRDPQAIAQLEQAFGSRARIIKDDYAGALAQLSGPYDVILADLGVSSPQLDNSNRGFSFKVSAPLDMRMDSTADFTAEQIVNHFTERDLADLIYQFGEERQSRPIARAIVQARPLSDTKQLAQIVARAYRGKSRIHPATRTFQALRIAVNDELGQLARALPRIESLLAPGGRIGIISFHSLEDRLVKNFIRESQTLTPVNKKVVQGKNEDVSNPRARSAKLRVAIKNTNGHTLDSPRRTGAKNKQEVRNGH
ncbi:MAG: 16S rRNA (cytosine(1402)-N(4))-methyltransferase RsmH [Candidatus Saccharimonadales bacterium]